MTARGGRPVAAALAIPFAAWLAVAAVGAQTRDAAAVDAIAPATPLTPAERARILAHGPWPPAPSADPTNRFDGDPRAIALGARLFADKGLSNGGRVACADCHRPGFGYADGLAVAVGAGRHHRNSQGLFDMAGRRWFGWDGGADSLWAAALRPMFTPIEMAADERTLAATLRADPVYAAWVADARDDRHAAVLAAKAIAAYVATLRSPRTRFDDFRDALAREVPAADAGLTAAELRGLRLFVGEGRCHFCHLGPTFTNDEFHDIGRPFYIARRRVDPGRFAGVARARADPFNLLGAFNDERAQPGGSAVPASAWKTRGLRTHELQFGAFKTPGLRQLAHTAPYMHDGSLATLADVVDHYSELDPERMHTEGESLLRPLRLGATARADLVAFLCALSGPPDWLPDAAAREAALERAAWAGCMLRPAAHTSSAGVAPHPPLEPPARARGAR